MLHSRHQAWIDVITLQVPPLRVWDIGGACQTIILPVILVSLTAYALSNLPHKLHLLSKASDIHVHVFSGLQSYAFPLD